jgi:hypothetical protein
VGVGVGVVILRKSVDGRIIVFVGLIVEVVVGAGVNVTEGPRVTVGGISALVVAEIVGFKVTVGVRPSLFSSEELLELLPKKYELAPTTINNSSKTTTIRTFLTNRTLLLIFLLVNKRC